MNEFLKKLTSRKLWFALAGVVTGIAVIVGVDASELETALGLITTLGSALAYIITEGVVDAKSVTKVIEAVEDVVEVIETTEEEGE